MNIAGVIKDWMLIFFSFYLFKAPVTALNLAGYAFCCTGVLLLLTALPAGLHFWMSLFMFVVLFLKHVRMVL